MSIALRGPGRESPRELRAGGDRAAAAGRNRLRAVFRPVGAEDRPHYPATSRSGSACSARRSPRGKASCSRSRPASSCRRAGSARRAHRRGRGRRDGLDDPGDRQRRAPLVDREAGNIVADGVPTWVADLALPVGFALIAVRLVCALRRSGRAAALRRSASSPASCSPAPELLEVTRCALAGRAAPRGASSARRSSRCSAASRSSPRRHGRPPPSCRRGLREADDVAGSRRSRCSRSPGSCSPRASRRNDCCACSAPGSAGRRAARPWRRRRSVRSSRSSPAARASPFSCWAGCCCRRSSARAIASGFRSASSPPPARSAAVSAVAAADALRHRVAGQGVDRRSLHRRAAAGAADARAARAARRARRARGERQPDAVPRAGGLRARSGKRSGS